MTGLVCESCPSGRAEWYPTRPPVESAAVSTFRSGHLFAGLMVLSFASAFVLPRRMTTPLRSQVQGLFVPVSRPVRAIAGAIYGRVHPDRPTDDASPSAPRAAEAVYAENHELRAQLAGLQEKFDQLSRLNADRQVLGDIRSLCRPATVTGADSSGLREALKITGVGSAAAGRPVVHGGDLVGRVVASGLTGAEVRLVTDPGFAFTARFKRYVPDAAGRVSLVEVAGLQPVVQGVGHGAMAIRSSVSVQQVDDLHLATGDLVVLADPDWPLNVQGFCAGRISAITRQANAPMFADIRVEPAAGLMRLSEVMVVVKD